MPGDVGVGTAEGPPPGEPLAALLAPGLPPERVALELLAALCEILVIAKEDGAVHGDVGVDDVAVTAEGVVAVGGFGLDRASTNAPEGTPQGAPTDAYGVGRVGAALLCAAADRLKAAPTGSANDHDDLVFDVVMSADLSRLDPKSQNDVRWFLIHLLSFDRVQRPDPERAWRALTTYAATAPGPSLVAWAAQAARGHADVRQAPVAALGGPLVSAGPLGRAMDFTPVDGQPRTACWTREEAVARGSSPTTPDVADDEVDAAPAPAPRPHRAAATAFLDLDEVRAAPARVAPPPPPVEAPPVRLPNPVVVRGPAPKAEPAPARSLLETLSPGMVVFLGAAVTLFLVACLALVGAVVWLLAVRGG